MHVLKVLTFTSKVNYLRCFYYCSCSNARFLLQHSLVNFEEQLRDIPDIECNFRARRRTPQIDLHSLKRLHAIFKDIANRKKCFNTEDNCSVYKSHQAESLDVCVKHFKTMIYHHLFGVPNKLSERTPRGDEDITILTKSFLEPPPFADDHVVRGKKLKVLRYEDKATYYLENDAASLELATIRFVSDQLENERSFKPFRNPDTCNNFILRGVVGDSLSSHAIHLLDDFQLLVGSASLSSFCALRVATSTHSKFLPEHFFVCGRRYVPSINENGLFGVCQRTDINFFISTTSSETMMKEFDDMLNWLMKFYENLGLDFRVCYTRAADLTLAESCRATIQLFSIWEKRYIDVARISSYDSFISRRLKILCHDAKRVSNFLYLVDGVVISVPTLIACLLERSTEKLFVPECIRPRMLTHQNNAKRGL